CRCSTFQQTVIYSVTADVDRCSNDLFTLFRIAGRPERYTLSLHDALPIFYGDASRYTVPLSASTYSSRLASSPNESGVPRLRSRDRKSTRLNSSHGSN